MSSHRQGPAVRPIKLLANTALATIFVSNDNIYTYCQTTDCELVEISGKIETLENGSLPTYAPAGGLMFISETKEKIETAAKRFTPLAATPLKYWFDGHPRRYLFYVDCNDYLRDVYEDSGKWCPGSLYSSLKLKCAPYSKLAAVTYRNAAGADFIFLYYQDCDDSGNIRLCGLSHEGWTCGRPPLSDPPLWGTAMTAVLPQPGIELKSDTQDPVVFFQQTSLELSSSQDDGTTDYTKYDIRDKTQALSGHAYIAAVDDKTNCWCFYTSDQNDIQRIRIDANGKLTRPVCVGLDRIPIPASPVAAVITADSPQKIVLFYLLHDTDAFQSWTNAFEGEVNDTEEYRRMTRPFDGEIKIFASTLTRISPDRWSASSGKLVVESLVAC